MGTIQVKIFSSIMAKDELMQFDCITAIHNRLATKIYHDSFLEESKRQILQQFIECSGTGPFLSNTHFYLVDTIQLPLTQFRLLHVPKSILHAYTYLVGTVINTEYDLEDFGYQFEKIILYATSLKLGTCLIGSGFNRSRFAELIHTKDFELIPCISPVGLPDNFQEDKETFSDLSYLLVEKSRKKKQGLFFDGNFTKPLRFDVSSHFLYALEMVRLAPSFKNRQPWRVVLESSHAVFHFYIDHSIPEIYLPQCEEMIDLQRVDIGAAMCHFELTLQQLDIQGQWKIIDPGIPLPSRSLEYVATWILSDD